MPVKFLGQNTSIIFQDYLNAGDVLIATCRRTGELERIREVIETTTTEGDEVGHVLGIKRGRMSMNNLSVFDEYGEETANDEQFRQWFEAGTLLYCAWTDEKDGYERIIDFYAYIESYRVVRNNNEGANFDVNLVWTQPTEYDIPVLACPVVTTESTVDSITLLFSGVAGTTYTFTRVDNLEVVTVDAFPWEAVFDGLTIDTEYTFELEVSQYGLDTLACSDIVVSTDAALSVNGFGGDTKEEACDEFNAQTVYYIGDFGINTELFEDAALTIPYDNYHYLKVGTLVYTVAGGVITGDVGICTIVYSYRVKAGDDPCSVTEYSFAYSASSTFETGITLYSNAELTVLLDDGDLIFAVPNPFPPVNTTAGDVPNEFDIYEIATGILGTNTGDRC